MNNKNDSAFEALIEARKITNYNDEVIAEHEREIKRLQNKKCADEHNECILAVNYFTAEKIKELCDRSNRVLKCDDINPEHYIQLFSDISNVKIEDIDFLIDRQKELDEAEKTLDNIKNDLKEKTSDGFLLSLAEILLGGKTNDD